MQEKLQRLEQRLAQLERNVCDDPRKQLDEVEKLLAKELTMLEGLERLAGMYGSGQAQQRAVTEKELLQLKQSVAALQGRREVLQAQLSGASQAPKRTGPIVAKVLFDFTARTDSEISIKEGDKLHIVKKVTAEWWYGDYNGKTGLFPSNYVEEIDLPTDPPPPTVSPVVQPQETLSVPEVQQLSSRHADRPKSAAIRPMNTRSPEDNVVGGPSELPPKSAATGTAEVLYDFQAQAEAEIAVSAGNVVNVIAEQGEWVEVELNGRTGMIPANYLKYCEGEEEENWTATALYDFEAQSPQELSFKQGEVIVLLECDEEAEWWTGQLPNGHNGSFPASYVRFNE